jgi:uncharacterized protein YbjT (DUF2867 family)
MIGPVLVTGGTGKTGRRVAEQLTARGAEVRAVSRSTVPAFDWTDEGSWGPVLDGVDALYLAPAEGMRVTGAFARRAARAGVRRIVLLSARGVHTPGYFDHQDQEVLTELFVDGESGVMGSGAEWTVVRPGWFMQNFDEGGFLGPVRAGRLELPVGDGAAAWIDAEDIAEVVATALVDGGHAGEAIELSGPRALRVEDVLALITSETGRRVDYVPVEDEAYRDALRADGLDEDEVAVASAGFSAIRRGSEAAITTGVRQVLGRDPASVEDYVRHAADAWR